MAQLEPVSAPDKAGDARPEVTDVVPTPISRDAHADAPNIKQNKNTNLVMPKSATRFASEGN